MSLRPESAAGRGFDLSRSRCACLKAAVADTDRHSSGESGAALDHLDIGRPIERSRFAGISLIRSFFRGRSMRTSPASLADGDTMNGGTLDFVQRVAGGDQNLLRVQPRFRAGPAEVVRFDHGDRHSARLTGPVTPMPALPAARITTSNFQISLHCPAQW